MRLTRVVIEKFRNLEGLDLDLTGPDGKASPFVAIVGPNGCGKTAILEAILAGTRRALRDDRYGSIAVEFDSKPVRWSATRPGPEGRLSNTIPFLYFPASGNPRFDEGPKQVDAPGFLAVSEDAVASRSRGVLARWIARTLAGGRIPAIESALSPFLGGRVFRDFDETSLEPRFEDGDGRIYRFHELSAGQRRLTYLFAEIAMVCGRDGLLLFDEPETHLHPAWQLKMRQALMDLLPEGQVIVATHSPFIIDGMPPHQLFVLGDIGATSWSASA